MLERAAPRAARSALWTACADAWLGSRAVQTARLELRPIAEEHVEALADARRSAARSARPSTRSASTCPRTRRPCAPTSAASSAEPGFLAAIERAERCAAWGGSSSRSTDGRPGERELGYRLRPDAWGQGYATEGAAALLRDAFARPGIARVYAHSLLDNPASIRVMREDRHDLRRPVVLPAGCPGAEYEALAPSGDRPALNDHGPLPMGGPDRSWRPSQAAQRAKGCALRRRGCARWGVTQQWVRAGTVPARPGRTGALRGARCGWGAGRSTGPCGLALGRPHPRRRTRGRGRWCSSRAWRRRRPGRRRAGRSRAMKTRPAGGSRQGRTCVREPRPGVGRKRGCCKRTCRAARRSAGAAAS